MKRMLPKSARHKLKRAHSTHFQNFESKITDQIPMKWADVCIIGIAGSSGSGKLHFHRGVFFYFAIYFNSVYQRFRHHASIFSQRALLTSRFRPKGKSTLSHAIVSKLNLPWVV